MGRLARKVRVGRLRRMVAAGLGMALVLSPLTVVVAPGVAHAAGPNVLLVGTYNGVPGTYNSIQAAVDAAQPGDWILVGPGDYKEQNDHVNGVRWNTPGGVVITKAGIHLRGMDRNGVVVDGTAPGSPACNFNPKYQDYGVTGSNGKQLGRNGILIWKADNVSVENLTVCNFLNGASNAGNEIWWDGGANSAQIGGYGFSGSYLSATSTFFKDEATAAAYGIFSSNWSGGTWNQTYASNFNDSGYYIGACQQVCNQIVDHAHAQYNALGYSGSNSGGQLIVKNSEFDHNQDGFDTNSQNGDNPPPQDGACPGNGISPVTHTHSCWVFMDNYVHDNNNPNVPAAGSAAAAPVGTGLSLSGGRNDTVTGNVFANNGAWGTIFVPYPDSGPPCTGGINVPSLCLYDDWGNALYGNTYAHNGFFGNPTNADFAESNLTPAPSNCYGGNVEAGGGQVTSSPPLLETLRPTCSGTALPDPNPLFLLEVACDSQISIGPLGGSTACLPGGQYPRQTAVVMHPLPKHLTTMPNPCVNVPAVPTNLWCKSGVPIGS